MAREGLAIVGAAVGFWIGGPLGASIGASIGGAIGGYIDPIKVPHPGLNEAPVQTGRDGVPIPIGWGLVHLHGNIIQQNPLITTRTWERQGKGGSTKVEKITRTRTFAIGLCRSATGPISSVRRIWENDRLVYDMRDTPTLPIADTQEYAEGITIYYGDESQLPDPELESHTGVGQCPAYRGLAYIVFNNFDLTETGGAIPQFRFEILTGEDLTVTSRPYPLEAEDGIQAGLAVQAAYLLQIPTDAYDGTVTPQSGELRAVLDSYTIPDEAYEATVTPQSGVLKVVLHTYTIPDEAYEATVTPQGGELRLAVVEYTIPDEAYEGTVTPQSGTLYTP